MTPQKDIVVLLKDEEGDDNECGFKSSLCVSFCINTFPRLRILNFDSVTLRAPCSCFTML